MDRKDINLGQKDNVFLSFGEALPTSSHAAGSLPGDRRVTLEHLGHPMDTLHKVARRFVKVGYDNLPAENDILYITRSVSPGHAGHPARAA